MQKFFPLENHVTTEEILYAWIRKPWFRSPAYLVVVPKLKGKGLGRNKPLLFSIRLPSLNQNSDGITKAWEEGTWSSLASHSSDQRVGWSQGKKRSVDS